MVLARGEERAIVKAKLRLREINIKIPKTKKSTAIQQEQHLDQSPIQILRQIAIHNLR